MFWLWPQPNNQSTYVDITSGILELVMMNDGVGYLISNSNFMNNACHLDLVFSFQK